MKCKHCNGTGRRMEESDNGIGWISVKCEYCNGTGEIEVTNEKWFCSLPTKEKAKFLEDKMTWAAQEQGTFTAKGWEMWLKQPHTTIKE